jgi:membrane protease YdiL (CAAX protease family)
MMRWIRRTLILVLVLFSLANAARAALAIQFANTLPADLSAIPPAYLVLMGLVWAFAFGLTAIGVWRSRQWAARGTITTIMLYQANLWLNHFAFSRSTEATQREGFAALLSVISFVLISGAALIVNRHTSHVKS